jgi:hypothetical protein
MDNTSKSQTFENKEVKGVIDDELETKKECKCKGIDDQNQKTKGLPHQQVPQPEDFSTEAEALDKNLPPAQT